VKLMRGRALSEGRHEVGASDLAVLEWMTTFRVPPEVHAKIPELTARASGRGGGRN
jgi:hypothetical protein